jgi:hypothetical protein
MTYRLLNAHGRNMHHDDLYSALGLDPKNHLPAEGLAPQNINGIMVYVLPVDDPRRLRRFRSRRNGQMMTNMKGKRTYAICPGCERHIEAGHLHQHRCKEDLADKPV